MTQECFHCGEPLLGSRLTARVNGREEAVCCYGCRAVAELIAGAGLSDYYRFREASPTRPDAAALAHDTWAPYGQPEVATQFTRTSGQFDEVTLAVDGLRCSACSWLIEHVLQRLDGVARASVNASTGRVHVRWENTGLTLADIMRTIAQLGYRPSPLTDASILQLQQRERRDALKRLAVATLGMMQVMMFAVAGYSAQLAGEIMDASLQSFFRVVSLLVATPVMFYAGAPILASAWNSVRMRSVGMDVPVAIALALAFTASVWNTLVGRHGEVYFDSVTMFIFFLTLGRFVQMSVRHRTTSITDALARQLPAYAHRIDGEGISDVPASAVRPGELLLVRAGETLPLDGQLEDGDAMIDEAILTGESMPVPRRPGERLAAGTLNLHGPIHIRATAPATGTILSHIINLLQRAQADKPAISRAADAAAVRFLRYVLLGAGLTCGLWLYVDPARAFEATLAVLVVACPCAFAIAMPAALSAATAGLARGGVLITKPDALEALARVDRIIFDKTGTLTRGEITVHSSITLADVSEARCLQIAAAIELASEHPLARAFAPFGDGLLAQEIRTSTGAGVEGIVDGVRYRIGTPQFVAELNGGSAVPAGYVDVPGTIVALGDEHQPLALFVLRDVPRAGAHSAVGSLRELNVAAQILSGDNGAAVASVAERCGINEYFASHSPQQKLAHVQALQAAGRRIAMVGDGVNDAPVLAAADVSIAMGRGAALAHASADMVLVSEHLDSLPSAIRVARRTLAIARQNMLWSAVYNFGALPLAALGLVPPWLAALGMSLSSVGVVLNATRLLPSRHPSAANRSQHGAPVAQAAASPSGMSAAVPTAPIANAKAIP